MIEPSNFIEELATDGYQFVIGVPCSNISNLFHALERTKILRYIPAATEGEALAIASGTWFAGKKAAVICQNSGVGNMINPLASLNAPYQIPATLFVSMRGAPGFSDEWQHDIMGRETGSLLKLVDVESSPFPEALHQIPEALLKAHLRAEEGKSTAFLINPGVFNNTQALNIGDVPLNLPAKTMVQQWIAGDSPTRSEAIAILTEAFGKAAVIATTGFTYRELHATGDRPNYFYMTGSMGHAAALGLGVAINGVPTMVLDGDGALLMKMGTCATIGRQAPNNLLHVVLDNGTYDSTGGQTTSAGAVDFASIAVACNYRQVWQLFGEEALETFCSHVDPLAGPTFVHVSIAPSKKTEPRSGLDLPVLAKRFQRLVTRGSHASLEQS